MIGQPLPEDMFSMPMQQTQQGRGRGQQLPIGFTGGFAGGPGAAYIFIHSFNGVQCVLLVLQSLHE